MRAYQMPVQKDCAPGCPSYARGPERLRAIIESQTEIARQGLDVGGVMALIAERSQSLTAAQGAAIEMVEGEDLVARAVCGILADQLGARIRRHSSLSGVCISQNLAQRCEDAEIDPRVDREICRRIGVRSLIAVPLWQAGIVIGVLKVVARAPHAFDAHDVETLTLISGVSAAAMFNAVNLNTNELFRRATHDPLTGLPNRALFYDRLRQTLAQAQRTRQHVAVMSMDMDGLKAINDRWGHRAGDAAIREVANRICRDLRGTDTPARLGGDEFAVIMVPIEGVQGARQAARRLAQRVAAPYCFDDFPLDLRISVGAAVFPEDGDDVERLMDLADRRMYENKRARRVPPFPGTPRGATLAPN